MKQTAITDDMIPAMQGVIPCTLATCSSDGIPNVTYISQLFYIDKTHVALSWQFMNKSWKNLKENPQLAVVITEPQNMSIWKLRLEFIEVQESGPLYEQMEMEFLALAGRAPANINFKIKAAVICKIIEVEKLHDRINA